MRFTLVPLAPLALLPGLLACIPTGLPPVDGGAKTDGGDVGADGGDVDPDGGVVGAAFTCTTATLFAGDPDDSDNVQNRPAEGTHIASPPPFPFRTLVFSEGQLITHSGQEIWRADLDDGLLYKIAGTESQGQALITGACASARFANIFSIALGSDGALYVSDQTANAILKITNPLDASCTVQHFAGSSADIAEGIINPNNPPNQGETDGPGASAQFRLPERLAIDAADNLYVWDNGNGSLRKIASDGTVSTFADSPGDTVVTPVVLDDTLYVWGKDGNDLFLTGFDLGSAAPDELFRGRADLFGGSSSDSQTLGGIVTDGEGLIVHFNGQFFYVDTAGTISAPLAGQYRPGPEFPAGYDPAAQHDAEDLVIPTNTALVATAGMSSFLAIDDSDDLYFTGNRLNRYVVKLACE